LCNGGFTQLSFGEGFDFVFAAPGDPAIVGKKVYAKPSFAKALTSRKLGE
jgi:hypothetical protein